ncbi:MAG: UvrD-helicase domain-containing protein [Bacilli bacterium]|nr:UvrD-helicase domain-containing protein [Bacilli bacterium]
MSRNWTKEQLDAIEKSGTNIIVSAGAGSGKTAVLTERVVRKLKHGVGIDSLLVLTFTKAAAHEMKERIREELKNDISLKKQLSLLDASYITTFDSFALSVVKKYHYILNISSHVSICDSNILKMEKTNIINNIFDELYKQENPKFLKLIGELCVKDDTNIKNYILKINDKLGMRYDRDKYLTDYLEQFFNESKINGDVFSFTNMIADRCKRIKKILDKISNYVETDFYESLESSLESLLNSKTYNEYKNNLNITLPRLPRGVAEEAKVYKDDINNILKELNNICCYKDYAEIKDSILLTKDYVDTFIDVIKELDIRIKKYKYDNDLYEFNDIANLSIRIVKENKDIREELKNSFHEILVDEYQDTNDLQEEFISLIGNNNVYMVGDIKQSIYRFRNANPNIFKEKYEQYKNNNNGLKIDLNKNFRSRGEVLNNINLIFDDIMDFNFGGADYKNEHRLELGNTSFDSIGKTVHDNNLEIYNYQYDKDLGFKKEELEIFLIANDIKTKIENQYQVMDGNNGLRNVTYSDFSILLDRSTNFDLYKKVFTFMKIPLIVYKDESVASTSDILVIKSILKLILCLRDNKYDNEFKYVFMSVGRSFLFDYSDNDLFNFITNETYKDTELYQKALELSKISDSVSIDALINMVVRDFSIYEKTIRVGNVDEMISRIEYLLENAKTLSQMGYTLDKFTLYLDEFLNSKSDVKIPLSNMVDDACRIMTIHKSKGLEYNICYYAGIYLLFNIRDLTELFYYDNDYGIIAPYFKEGISNTIYKTLLREKYIKEEIEEKVRLFYVALTRCKEKMIIVTDLDSKEVSYDYDNNGLVELSSRLGYRSFKDILLSIRDRLTSYIKNIEIGDNLISHDYNIFNNIDYKKRIPSSSIKIVNAEIKIDSAPLKETSYSKKTNELLDNNSFEDIKIGNYIHSYLENLDFENPNFEDIEDLYKTKITSFLKLDIMKDLDKSKVYKEYEFIYTEDNEEHHGIIDLMLEFDDHIKIIDYKLKNIDSEYYDKQLNGYREYINSISDKRVELYLYSIIDEKYKKL